MADECSTLAGQLDTSLGVEELASALASRGFRVRVRESSHYQGGRYVRVGDDDSYFVLEHLPGEFLAHADVPTAEQMLALVTHLSLALTDLNVQHRFEVYGGDSGVLVAYLHHRWPPPESATPREERGQTESGLVPGS